MKEREVDKIFLTIVLALLFSGFFIFLSASLGLLAKDGNIFSRVTTKQIAISLFIALPAMIFAANYRYYQWKKFALIMFLAAAALTALVFFDRFAITVNGARRWVHLGSLSIQPSEFLKFSFVIFLAAWLSHVKEKIQNFWKGLVVFASILIIPGILLVLQPDNDTLMVLAITAFAMFIIAGGKWRHLLILFAGLIITALIIIMNRPYIMERIMTFLDPGRDPLGSSYQIHQALIAIGSGEIAGRGFGQSVQKFNYLPEPVSDSIFAVAAEEFGFIGSSIMILLFLLFVLRGLSISIRAPDAFGRLTASGLVILIGVQSFLNIAAMLGLFPLSGLPLVFISQGGTALVLAMLSSGVVLNISKYKQ